MNQDWNSLTAEEKRQARRQKWLSPDNFEFASAEARQAFLDREQRLEDIIQLRTPDRVPIWFNDMGFFQARYAGKTCEEVLYDSEAFASAFKKTILDFAPDVYWSPTVAHPGKVLEILESKTNKWPGHGLPANSTTQYIEDEYMKADEYDELIDNPTDFLLRKYMPRTLGVCEPFSAIPSFDGYNRGERVIEEFLKPDILAAFKKLAQLEPLIARHRQVMAALDTELKQAGFPLMSPAYTSCPFDYISDSFRGMQGIMLDMFRQPDKLLEAMDRLLPKLIAATVNDANNAGHPRIQSVIHHGSDSFMSIKQYEKFFWPGLKKTLQAFIDEGLTPVVFLEGNVDSRLEYFLELPAKKMLLLIDSSDIFRAKEILGQHSALAGNISNMLLHSSTPDEIKAYARKLIDVVGKDGGFLMAPRSTMDDTDPELVKIWFDFTREYGVYR